MNWLAGLMVGVVVFGVAPLTSGQDGPQLPGCGGGQGVQIQTAVWLAESKSYLMGLTPEKFRLTNRERTLPVRCFSEPDQPHTVGFILDYSSSIKGSTSKLFVEGIREFITHANEKNTYFGIGFRDKPFVMMEPSSKPSDMDTFISAASAENRGGGTGLNDAVQLALERMPADNPGRKILIIASDGNDTASKYSNESAISKRLRNAGIRVYVARIFERNNVISMESMQGDERLYGFAMRTGGGVLPGSRERGLSAAFGRLSRMLRAEYILGVDLGAEQGKWHEVDFAVKVPKEFEKVTTTAARRIYY